MTEELPMFALNSVLFPGMSVPLRVFEDRYRAMIEHLLSISNPSQRLFFSVAIREGYEVGDHGVQSLYRVGCRLQLTEVATEPDGSYQVVAVVRDRVRLHQINTDRAFPVGTVELLEESGEPTPDELANRVEARFSQWVSELSALGRGIEIQTLPQDIAFRSWILAAAAPFPMAERQALLEAAGARERLELLDSYLWQELRAMKAIGSLPATELARTRWSPN